MKTEGGGIFLAPTPREGFFLFFLQYDNLERWAVKKKGAKPNLAHSQNICTAEKNKSDLISV